MKKILLYIGTFDPIHKGHIHFCTEALKLSNSNLCVIMPSGNNNYKSPTVTTNALSRYENCKRAVQDFDNIIVSDLEVLQEGFIYTLNTLEHMKELFSDSEICLLMGSDTFLSIRYWKGSSEIISSTKIFTCIRKGDEITKVENMCTEINKMGGYAEILPIDTIDISSEMIRNNPNKFSNFLLD